MCRGIWGGVVRCGPKQGCLWADDGGCGRAELAGRCLVCVVVSGCGGRLSKACTMLEGQRPCSEGLVGFGPWGGANSVSSGVGWRGWICFRDLNTLGNRPSRDEKFGIDSQLLREPGQNWAASRASVLSTKWDRKRYDRPQHRHPHLASYKTSAGDRWGVFSNDRGSVLLSISSMLETSAGTESRVPSF